jgi:RNA polymerase sigma-70 factor (ECF subfamily)
MDDTRQWIEALYRETGPQLLVFLSQRVGESGGAQDLLQETFAAALRNPERLRATRSARAYLFGIARHLAASDRRRSARSFQPLPANLAAEETISDPRLEWLRAGIARLKPEFREALELRLQHELSYEEMAEALDLPIGTVRSRLHNAVSQLRRLVHQADPVPVVRKEET